MSGAQSEFVAIPGWDTGFVIERTEDGRLLAMSGGGRLYVDAATPERTTYDGLAAVETVFLPSGFVRRVAAGGEQWTERHSWDELGRIACVDGVDFDYDADGRVIACRGEGGWSWHYGYAGPHLSVISGPFGLRQIVRGEDGRALAWRGDGPVGEIFYDAAGRRAGVAPPPATWRCDPLGRRIAIAAPDGSIARSFLWDGWHCLGAIDGLPGAPLAEVYLLDPTGTPVRRIRAGRVDRLPRDAFGEGLIGTGAPGLFGGALHAGLVHLPLRRLDPLTGSFDAPDPVDGEAGDPRRALGWDGPLPVELPAAGPYTVCRNNPVSLADPTGGISDLWWLIPSSLTWSISNTIGSLLGMWFNLQFSPIGWIVSAATGHKPFDLEWVAANNYDSFALRTDGFLAAPDHAFTYQFMMSADSKQLTDLEDTRLFAPAAAFRPVLYGSVLRCAADGASPFLLLGQRAAPNAAPLITWSRAGGVAEPSFPGSRIPVFPSGGLHLGAVQRGIRQGPATLTEMVPSGTVLAATIGQFAGITVPGTSLGIAEGFAFALTDAAGVLTAGRVLSVHETIGVTLLRSDAVLAGLGAAPLVLDGLTAPLIEPLTPVPGRDHHLEMTGSSLDYVPAVSVVRLSRSGGPPLGAAGVAALEARVVLDEALPVSLAARTPVRSATATGNFTATLGPGPNDLTIVTGAAPAPPQGVVAGPVATGIAAIVVVTDVATNVVTLDRPLGTLGAPGDTVAWSQLAPGGEIGRLTAAPDGTVNLSYAPGTPGTAPAAGFIWCDGATPVARRVTARTYDAAVLAEALPDANPAAFTVERFRRIAPSISGVLASNAATIALSAPLPAETKALQILGFPGPAPATGTVLAAGTTLAAGVASTSVAAGSGNAALRPGEVVALIPAAGGAAIPAQIAKVKLTVTFDRRLPFSGATVEVARLSTDTLVYPAARLGGRILKLSPVIGGARLDLPRFVIGDLVVVNWPGPPAGLRLFRIAGVSGATITADTDAPDIPAGTVSITVTRLFASDPGTGSARLGLHGADAGGAAITFDVWQPSDFPVDRIVAVIDGAIARAVRVVAAVNQPLAIELSGAAALAGAHDIAAFAAAGQFTAGFTRDGQVLTVTDIPAAMALAGMASAVVAPWVDGAVTVAGEVHPGSVRIPEDHENASLELTRRQAVTDHELTHTLQSAKWGPLLLTAFPMWALELATDLTSAGGPEFSPYVEATLGEGKLTFPAGFVVEAGGHVQVAQNGRALLVDLGPSVTGQVANLQDAVRSTLSAANITAGPVMVRKPLTSTGANVLEWFTNIGQLLTVGGLLNNITLLSWGGIAALITEAVSAIRSAARSTSVMTLAADQKTLALNPVSSLEGLASGMLLAVKFHDAIVIRAVESLTATTAVLGAPTPQWSTGAPAPVDVEVSIYAPGAALFGLRDYFTAAMPDVNQPARLLFSGAGGKPTLAVHDRIEIRAASGTTQRTLVTLVDGDAIEFADPLLPANTAANEFLVGKVSSQDATGWLDSWLLDELNIGWMQYAYDPWGHIIAGHMPDRSNIAGQIFARSAKYLFGTQSWGIPPLGYFWFDNAFRDRAPPNPTAQRSQMEQEASRHSGDTYCPLGTLNAEPAVVGDVARYWLTVTGGTRDRGGTDTGGLVMPNLQDAPGVALAGPTLALAAGGGTPPVPTALAATDASGNFAAILPTAWVPVSAHLERSAGINFAYTRPPVAGAQFRVTAAGLSSLAASVDAQANGAATIFFDRAPADVAVAAAGVAVAENARFDMIPFQRVTFAVAPDGARAYRTTVGGPAGLFDAADLTLTARATLGDDDVEISRHHAFDSDSGTFASGIGPFHLPADIDIGVRRFPAHIGNILPLRASPIAPATLSHTQPGVATARPGDTLLLMIPAQIAAAVPASVFAGTPPLTPLIAPAPASADPAVIAFIGDGGILGVTLPADQPPEAAADLVVTVSVGPAGSAVPVTATVTVQPHFTLGGGAAAAPGGTIVLTASDGTALLAPPVLPPGVDAIDIAAAQATIHLNAAAPAGPITILIADQGNATRMARRIITVT